MSDYLFDKQGDGEGDPSATEVAELERLLGGYTHEAPMTAPLPERRRAANVSVYALVVALAAAVAVALLWPWSDGGREATQPIAGASAEGVPAPAPTPPPAACAAGGSGFRFEARGGAATCDGGTAHDGVLPVGGWLETAPGTTATVQVADIGALTIFEGSRLRLLGTGVDEHRLELERGKLSALVSAPPRLFVVDTPAATAVDLGCAYELAVDEKRRTHLEVTMGAVSLEHDDLLAWVPAGHEVWAEPERGPGLPLAIEADASLRAAARRFDAGDRAAVPELVRATDEDDLGTLWNLLARTDGDDRALVYARLQRLRPHPSSVPERDLLAGEPAALEAWRLALEDELFQ